eukprot:4925139-Pyramimonas_sp.AAC.1
MIKAKTKGRTSSLEIFSPPRIAPEVDRKGGTLGERSSLDRLTGWDSLRPSHARDLWTQIEQEEPEMIWMSSECRVFSAMNRINRDRRDPDRWHCE